MAGNDAVFLALVLSCTLCITQVVQILIVNCEEIILKESVLALLAFR